MLSGVAVDFGQYTRSYTRKADSVNKRTPAKSRDFPLFPHARGYWAKKIRGKMHYFGKIADDPQGEKALQQYLDQRDDLQAGRTPRARCTGPTVRDLLESFLSAKDHLLATGELSPRTFAGYKRTADRLAAHFGLSRPLDDLHPEDFTAFRGALAKGRGTVSLANEVRHARIIVRYAYDARLVKAPIEVGPLFKEPNKKAKRRAKREAGTRELTREELIYAIDNAGQPLRSMILLGINCGFGQTDCARLPVLAIDLDRGWIDFPRPKTEVDRRCPLWPETIAALREALPMRPKPKDRSDVGLAFITKRGRPFVRMQASAAGFTSVDAIALAFAKLLKAGEHKRPGINFYAIRHTFRTIADGAKDQPAANALMGHDPGDMASLYRERIDDDRLRAVVDHVHDWLFNE